MADLKLKIFLDAADRISAPFKKARQSSDALRAGVSEAARKVRALEQTAKDMAAFRKLKTDSRANASALAAAQDKVAKLAREMAAADRVTKGMRTEFAAAKREATRLGTAMDADAATTQALRAKLAAAGVNTGQFGAAQRRLKADLDAARAAADRQSQALDRARRRTEGLAKARAKMDATLGRSQSIAASGAAGMATGGVALAGISRIAGAGIGFEEQMSGVAAISRLDKTSAEYKALEEQAKKLGASTSFSASEAAAGMQFLAMSGFDANQVLAAMPGMLDLAKAGNMDLAKTADIASNILSGFGLEAADMGRVGDVLAATFTRSNVNLEMLGESMKYVAPVAKELGASVEDAAAMAGLLGNVGIQGSMAGTALRALYTRLAAPPKKGAEALAQIGVETRKANGDMRDMSDIMSDVAKKTEKLGNAERMGIFKAVAGDEAGAAMAQLVNEGGAGKITQFADINRNSQGEASKIASVMGDNTAGDIKGFWSSVEGLNIALTETNITPLRDLIQTATGAVRVVADWVRENPRLAGGLAKVAAVIAGLVFAAGSLAVAVAGILGPFAMARFAMTTLGVKAGGLRSSFGWIKKGLSGLMSVARIAFPLMVSGIRAVGIALMTNPIGLIITAIVAAIAAAAYLIYSNWEPISGFFIGLLDRVSAKFRVTWDFIKELFLKYSLPGLIISNWEPISGFFSGLWDGITATFGAAWDFIMSRLDALKAPIEWLSSAMDDLFGSDDGSTAPAPVPIRTRSTAGHAAAVAAAGSSTTATTNNQIVVNAAPGMDEAALAREVSRQIEQREARRHARTRSRLYDGTE